MQECDRLKHCKAGVRIGTIAGPAQALCVSWKGAHNSYLGDTFAITLVNDVCKRRGTSIRKHDRDEATETYKSPDLLNKLRCFVQ